MAAVPEPRQAGVVPEWSLGDRLRKIRKDVAGVGQREFAAQLGVGWQAYAQWEAGGKPRDVIAIARRIELMTGVPAAWVLGVDQPAIAVDTPQRRTVSGDDMYTYRERNDDGVVVSLDARRAARGLTSGVAAMSPIRATAHG